MNLRKHGVGFAEANTVFNDPLSITIPDPDHGIDEERFVIIGTSDQRRLLIVVHTIRGERIRLVTASPWRAHLDYGKRVRVDSVGKVFRAACPRFFHRTKSSGAFALRLWHPLAFD